MRVRWVHRYSGSPSSGAFLYFHSNVVLLVRRVVSPFFLRGIFFLAILFDFLVQTPSGVLVCPSLCTLENKMRPSRSPTNHLLKKKRVLKNQQNKWIRNIHVFNRCNNATIRNPCVTHLANFGRRPFVHGWKYPSVEPPVFCPTMHNWLSCKCNRTVLVFVRL